VWRLQRGRHVVLAGALALGACGGRSFEPGVYDEPVDHGTAASGARGGAGAAPAAGAPAQGGSGGGAASSSSGGQTSVGGGTAALPAGGAAGRGAGVFGGAAGGGGAASAGRATSVGGSAEPVGAAGLTAVYDDAPSSRFDPELVYLFGSLIEGSCSAGALVPLLEPGDVRASLDSCDGRAPKISRDSRLVYNFRGVADNSLRWFEADGRVVLRTASQPWANDEVIPTLCGSEGQTGFWLDPDGELVYQCDEHFPCTSETCPYHLESGGDYAVPAGYSLAALGYGESALLVESASALLWIRVGSAAPIATEKGDATPIRAHSGGFWILANEQVGESPVRLSIGFDGVVTRDGEYPELPVSSVFDFLGQQGNWYNAAFDAEGRAYCFGQSALVKSQDQVFRLDLDEAIATVVYSEGSKPPVSIHISELVSGP